MSERCLFGTLAGAALPRLARIGALALWAVAFASQAQLSDIRPVSPILPDAAINQGYFVRFTPVNPAGGLPVTWSITPGCLDGTGLGFTPQNGLANSARIGGVPRLRGTFFCTI